MHTVARWTMLVVGMVTVGGVSIGASSQEARSLPAVRALGPIVIDGRLDEPAWLSAAVAADFVQSDPVEGAPASERTEVRVLYDDRALYVGVFAHHARPDDIVVNELKRDFDGSSTDWVAVIVDPFHDRRNGYQFGVNPRGATWDSQKFNEGRERNLSWDGAWRVRTTIGSDGWRAEFAIPFRTLQMPKTPVQTWGINFQRHLQRKLEESFWAPLPRQYALDRLSLAGTLEGLEEVRTGRNLRLKPYVVARARSSTSPAGRDVFDVGGDLKYNLTPSLTGELSINTDFSQVEADVQQVGATRFSVLFPEKREFFLENSGIFQFGPGNARAALISAAPGTSAGGRDNSVQNDLALFFSRRIGLSSAGDALPILAGGRFSGRVAGATVGALLVRQRGRGDEPGSAFTVLRMRRQFGTGLDVGAMMLDRRNDETTGSRAAGVDINVRPTADLLIYGYAANAFEPSSRVVDGRAVAARSGFTWQTGRWVADASYGLIGARFEDQIGFVPRTGIERRQVLGGHHFRQQTSRWLRDIYLAAGLTDVRRERGGFDSRYGEYRAVVTFRDGATIEAGGNPNDETLASPFVVSARRAIAVAPGRYTFTDHFLAAATSKARPYALDGRVVSGRYYDGRRTLVQVGASARVNVHLSGSIAVTRDAVTLPAAAVTTHLVTARVSYGFSTRAFVQGLVQYNSSAERWDTNVRFNLLHRPLSDLFVVYSDQRDPLLRSTPNRSLTIKLTQLLSF